MSDITYTRPTTIKEAVSAAQQTGGDYIYMAGGTDVQVHRMQGLAKQKNIIDISEIDALQEIEFTDDAVWIGSGVTLATLASNSMIRKKLPLLAEAAMAIASPVLRQTATVGGNLLVAGRCSFYDQSQMWRDSIGSCLRDSGDICHVTGTDSACYARNVSDLAPALIALGAEIEWSDSTGSQLSDLINIYNADGLKPIKVLGDNAIVTGVRIRLEDHRHWFKKLRLRESVDFGSLTIAAVTRNNRYRVCLNGVSMSPILLEGNGVESAQSELISEARNHCKTVENDLMPLKYRREMIRHYLGLWWTASFSID